jgi:hypothetical protein
MKSTNVTIASGQQVSTSFRMADYDIPALIMPAAFTSTSVTFQGAVANSDTFKDIYDSNGNLISVVVGVDRCVSLSSVATDLFGYGFIKIKSASAEGASRTIVVVG